MLYYNNMDSVKPLPSLRQRIRRMLDRTGACFSALCAVHCLLAPWLLALIPGLVLALHSHAHPHHRLAQALMGVARWEWLIVILACSIALITTGDGYRVHRQPKPLFFALAGCASFFLALAVPVLSASILAHTACTVSGGFLLVRAHLLNIKAAGIGARLEVEMPHRR